MNTSADPLPSLRVTTAVVFVVALLWLWLLVFSETFLPLSYLIPLLVCVWTRRRWHLALMTGVFAAAVLYKGLMLLPATELAAANTTYLLATLADIVIGAAAVELILRMRNRVDQQRDAVQRKNQALENQATELAQQNEEIKAQAEELAQQQAQMEMQAEEIERNNQELQEVNERLLSREEILQAAVDCTRSADGARSALEAICRRSLAVMGPPGAVMALLESRDGGLTVRAQVAEAEGGELPLHWPTDGSLAGEVLAQGRSTYVDDLGLRADLAAPFTAPLPYRTLLASPVRVGAQVVGVLVVAGREPGHWSQEQFRLIEWAAAQTGPLMESLRWQEALQERTAAVEGANRAKDQFLAMLSHELRTPLTPVLAAAGALEHDPRLPEDVRAELAMMQRNVAVQSRLIDDLLDLTRLSRGKLEVRRQVVPIAPLLREAAATVAGEMDANEQTLELNVRLPPGCAVSGDGARLQQVFWNLLKNSVKFSPRQGRITVTATLRPGHPLKPEASGETVTVRFVDRGIGIETPDLERIFRPFEQAERSGRVGAGGGLGLGLSIAQAIVHLHEGSIRVESEGAGCGAIFTVELPAERVAAGKGAVGAAPSRRQTATASTPLVILLVEDHGDTGRVMARLLRRAGHDVVHAETVTDALEHWRARRYDLIVSDIGLPDGSGLDLLRRIREQDTAVPAICMSGYGMESDVAASELVGFAEHLTKPIDMQQLHAAIQRLAPKRTPTG